MESKVTFISALVLLIVVSLSSSATLSKSAAPSITQASLKGVVSPIARCGGSGTPIQLRVSECEGRCQLVPGKLYDIEGDLIPSSAAPSLSLSVDLILNGFTFRIVDTVLENSSVQPGLVYTVAFYMVPNDVLSGQAVILRATLYNTDNLLIEICIESEVDIL